MEIPAGARLEDLRSRNAEARRTLEHPSTEKSFYSELADQSEAGPSESRSKREDKLRSASTQVIANATATSTPKHGFAGGEDFISFDTHPPQESSNKEAETRNNLRLPARPEVASEKATGKKRRWEEIDTNDGYTNKKQRVDAASRRCPWAADVDWEGCRNVAEMCVILFALDSVSLNNIQFTSVG